MNPVDATRDEGGGGAAAKYVPAPAPRCVPSWKYPDRSQTDRSQRGGGWGVELVYREVGRRPIKDRHLQSPWCRACAKRHGCISALCWGLDGTAQTRVIQLSGPQPRPELVPRGSLPLQVCLGRYREVSTDRLVRRCTVVSGEGRRGGGFRVVGQTAMPRTHATRARLSLPGVLLHALFGGRRRHAGGQLKKSEELDRGGEAGPALRASRFPGCVGQAEW